MSLPLLPSADQPADQLGTAGRVQLEGVLHPEIAARGFFLAQHTSAWVLHFDWRVPRFRGGACQHHLVIVVIAVGGAGPLQLGEESPV
jgi:hypothetical protein